MTGEVRKLGCDEIEALRPLIAEYPYVFNGQYLGDVPHRFVADAFLRRLGAELSHGSRFAMAWREGTEISGLGSVQHLEWDSQHFGISIARLELALRTSLDVPVIQELVRACLRVCGDQGIVHIASRVPLGLQKPIEALAGCCFRPVGVMLMLRAKQATIRPADQVPGIRLRDFHPGDAARVRELAGSAMTDTRFHRDGRFEPRLVAAMYESWMEKTWERKSGRIVVAERGNEVVGLLAHDIGIPIYGLKREEIADVETGFVGMVAVHPSARGLGMAKWLISECTGRLFRAGCDVVYANVMLSNEASVNAFLRTGFELKGSEQEFHIWP